jgi:hypothetical protein
VKVGRASRTLVWQGDTATSAIDFSPPRSPLIELVPSVLLSFKKFCTTSKFCSLALVPG